MRTLYSIDESAHLAKEMNTNEIDVMGSSECRTREIEVEHWRKCDFLWERAQST